jgi:16S rRNA (cytosine1402-N4)-methyltransferase
VTHGADLDQGHAAHQPVLLREAVHALAVQPEGIYVDATFGRGGHSREILRQLGPRGRLVAIDRDPLAVAAANASEWCDAASSPAERFRIVHARFSELDRMLDTLGIARVDGVLLDLGVSSPQLDDPARGFSFKHDGPLDMRMDPTRGISARQWLHEASVEDIAEALKTYGEERFAVPIAKAIDARRRSLGEDAFAGTRELAGLVAQVIGRRHGRASLGKDPATRTFQALRILVNQELEELSRVLDIAVMRLQQGGRLVVISFHSLEDRMVKQFMARESGREAPRDPVTGAKHLAGVRLRDPRRVLPDEAETQVNPRSRSAVLRYATRSAA